MAPPATRAEEEFGGPFGGSKFGQHLCDVRAVGLGPAFVESGLGAGQVGPEGVASDGPEGDEADCEDEAGGDEDADEAFLHGEGAGGAGEWRVAPDGARVASGVRRCAPG